MTLRECGAGTVSVQERSIDFAFTILIGVWYRKSQYWLMGVDVLICSRISGSSESNKKRADVSLIDLIAPLLRSKSHWARKLT